MLDRKVQARNSVWLVFSIDHKGHSKSSCYQRHRFEAAAAAAAQDPLLARNSISNDVMWDDFTSVFICANYIHVTFYLDTNRMFK